MLSNVELLILLAFLYGLYHFFNAKRKYKLPPGPINVPFFSGIFAIGPNPHFTFQKWAAKYGPLIRTKFGLADALIIDDGKLIREAFNNPAFSGKRDDKVFTIVSEGKHGIVSADGPEWAEQRRFVLRTLRDFGFGKQTMESFIIAEIQEFLKWMKKNEGLPTALNRRFTLAATNALWTILVGNRISQDDRDFEDFIDKRNKTFNDGLDMSNGIFTVFPNLVDILPKMFFKKWHILVEESKIQQKFVQDAIDTHLENPADETEPRDLVDVYLLEIKKTTDPNSSFYQKRGLKTLGIVVANLFGAAVGTTPSTLTWAVLYLIRFPEAQKKLRRELDTVIGRNRMPTLQDRANLPYTEALILEVHRYSTIAPLGLLHEVMVDTTLGGYDIKKGTVVIPNVYSLHYSQKIWGDPENFRPERFLSPEGTKVLKSDDLIPFGTGKRQCPGEPMARDSLFLFITSIYQRFEMVPDPGNPTPTLDPVPGFFRDAQKFQVLIKERIH